MGDDQCNRSKQYNISLFGTNHFFAMGTKWFCLNKKKHTHTYTDTNIQAEDQKQNED